MGLILSLYLHIVVGSWKQTTYEVAYSDLKRTYILHIVGIYTQNGASVNRTVDVAFYCSATGVVSKLRI